MIWKPSNADEDSDHEQRPTHVKGAEGDWRARFSEALLDEFFDMRPVEKIFFNAWNQFVLQEFRLLSDKDVHRAVMKFLESYGPAVKHMNLKTVFVRHVTMLSRCCPIDSDGVDEIWKKLSETKARDRQDMRMEYIVQKTLGEAVEMTDYEAAWLPGTSPPACEDVDEDHFGSKELPQKSDAKSAVPWTTTVSQLLGLPPIAQAHSDEGSTSVRPATLTPSPPPDGGGVGNEPRQM